MDLVNPIRQIAVNLVTFMSEILTALHTLITGGSIT